MYIDSHAHLFHKDYNQELDVVIGRARDAGVQSIVVPGTTLETSLEAVELAHRHDFIYACVGFHPHESSKASDQLLGEIELLSKDRKVVAIGEIGLDFHYDFSPRRQQMLVFKKQVEIARRRGLPIVVHTRESVAESIGILEQVSRGHSYWLNEQMTDGERNGKLKGVFHCFTGDARQAETLFSLGFLISYPGIVTFKNSPVLNTLQQLGYQRILLETDSPYMTPAPHRGKRNEPAYVVHVAAKIAELFAVTQAEIARVTGENARRLFGFG